MIDGIDSVNYYQYPSSPSLIFITTLVNHHKMKIMLDTGASYSFINADFLRFQDDFPYFNKRQKTFFLADGLTSLLVIGTVQLNIKLGNRRTTTQAFVAKHLCTSLILGMNYLSKYDFEIHTKKRSILFQVNDQRIVIPMDNEKTTNACTMNSAQTTASSSELDRQHPYKSEMSQVISTFHPSLQSDRSVFDQSNRTTTIHNPSLTSIQQQLMNLSNHIHGTDQHDLLRSLLFRFERNFDTSQYTIARTKITHVIETHPHTHPVSKCYSSNPALISEMRSIIDKLLKSGLVRPSNSPYAAAALLTKKKDQTWRLVVDYKKLNAVTIIDRYPIPNIEMTVQTLGGGYSFFSKLDLRSGFWQLPIDEKDRHKTAFITPFGLFEWNVLPQGLRNAPPSFQRVMSNVLASCSDFSLVYMDDIIVFSRGFKEHLQHVEQVLTALASHDLVLTPMKCEIAKQSIEYLGHLISSTRITPLPEKIKSILLLPEPTTLAKANKFIGSLSWYRKFIPGFASTAAPIHAVTNLSKANRSKFRWNEEQSKSFHDLKLLLTSSPLFLNFPDDSHPLLLSTDASTVGIGGILYQEINDEKKILYYHSELLSSSQKRYHPIELEALAIFKCMNRMKSLLLGRTIIIYTDNCPICHMMEKKVSNKRVEKISLLLQEFNIEKIIHVQGKFNCLPDYLSRNPISYDDELTEAEYGLGFQQHPTSSSIQLLGAVMTRSKAKALKIDTNPPPPTTQREEPTTDDKSTDTCIPDQSPIVSEHFDITQLKEYQMKDSKIEKIIQDLQSKPNPSFEIKDEILYKHVVNHHDKTEKQLIYVPSSVINSLISSYHDNPYVGGHFGIRRTLNKIRQKFWWPEMKRSVFNYVKSCLLCQAHNISRRKRPGLLSPIEVPDGPNQLLGMDYCGPFPTTPEENRYVLCLTDYFTKFVTAVPLPTCSAVVTAEAIFKEHICRYGVPKTIISDQGSSFKNQLMESLSKWLGFHHILCTTYHPQSNGLTERFNATFVIQLAKLTDRESNNWDQFLHSIVFAYNTGQHSSTNFSPFELLYGRQANLPTDPPPTEFIFPNSIDYLNQLVRSMQHYRDVVKDNINYQQRKSKSRYDHRRSNPQYDPGTTVLTRNFGKRSKLDPSFSLNPKIVIKCDHPVYWVEDSVTRKTSRIHVNDIRPLMLN